MSTLMLLIIIGVVIAGGVGCAVLMAYRHYVAAVLFFVVWVIGVVSFAVQAVLA
jgi:hypothetical protein